MTTDAVGLLRAFLAENFGAENVDRVWVTGFRDIGTARWHGAAGLDRLVGMVGGAEGLAEADLYFCIGLMGAGAPRRAADAVVEQPLLICDDIGTKVSRDAWEAMFAAGFPAPTWRIETSPGNETWGWVLDGDPRTVERAMELALIRAWLVAEGLTDNVMDTARYVRLPWGWNSKGKYRADGGKGTPPSVRRVGGSGARVSVDDVGRALIGRADWRSADTPDVGKTGTQLTAALASGALLRTADLRTPEPLIQLAEAIGLNPVQTRAGVVEALCPNRDAHGDRADTGFAFLGGGLCQCQHASCQHLRSPDFRAMMEDAYDEMVRAHEMLGIAVAGAPRTAGEFLARADFAAHGVDFSGAEGAGGVVTGDAAAVRAESDRIAASLAHSAAVRAAARDAALDLIASRFVWVQSTNSFFDTIMRDSHTPDAFDRHEAVTPVIPAGSSGMKRATNVILNHPGLQRVQATTYRPGVREAVVVDVSDNGTRAPQVNLWVASELQPLPEVPKDWLEVVSWVLPQAPYREWFLDRLAFMLQQPGVVSPVIPVIVSGQGVGKDLMMGPVIKAFGDHNVRSPTMLDLESGFNEWQKMQLAILPELQLDRDGRIYNRLKQWTGASSGRVRINPKYERPYTIPTVCNFIAFTNHADALRGMEHDDRRLAVYVSKNGKNTEAWYSRMAAALDDPLEQRRVLHFLLNRDLGSPAGGRGHIRRAPFNPATLSPDVDGSRAIMMAGALGVCGRWVYDQCQTGGMFHGRKFLSVNEIRQAALTPVSGVPQHIVNERQVRDGMRVAGCEPIGQVRVGADRMSPWFGPAMPPKDRREWAKRPMRKLAEEAKIELEALRASLVGIA